MGQGKYTETACAVAKGIKKEDIYEIDFATLDSSGVFEALSGIVAATKKWSKLHWSRSWKPWAAKSIKLVAPF